MGTRFIKINKESLLYCVAILYTVCVYGPMAVMSVGAGIVATAWLFLRRSHWREDLRIAYASPFFWPTIALAASGFWSLIWAKLSHLTFMGSQPTINWIGDSRKAWHLFFPFILAPLFALQSQAKLRKIVKLWLYLGFASALLGIIQYYVPLYQPTRLPHLDYENYSRGTGILSYLRGSYHATGMTGFHLSYASIMAFPAAVAFALVAIVYRREGLSRRFYQCSAMALAFFIAMILTYSKITWISIPLTVIFIALFGFKGRPRYAIIAAIVVFCVAWGSSSEFRLRFQGTDTIRDRIEVWSANIEMIRQFPLFGVGWHRNSELSHAYYDSKGLKGFESHAHNNLIDQWATTGIVGLISFIWLSAVAFILSANIYRSNHDLLWRSVGLGLLGGWFCLHLNGLTQANWWDAKVLHQIGWVTALTIELQRRAKGHRC